MKKIKKKRIQRLRVDKKRMRELTDAELGQAWGGSGGSGLCFCLCFCIFGNSGDGGYSGSS